MVISMSVANMNRIADDENRKREAERKRIEAEKRRDAETAAARRQADEKRVQELLNKNLQRTKETPPPDPPPTGQQWPADRDRVYMDLYLDNYGRRPEDRVPQSALHGPNGLYSPPPMAPMGYVGRENLPPALGPAPFHPDNLHEIKDERFSGDGANRYSLQIGREKMFPDLMSADAMRLKHGSYESKQIDDDLEGPPVADPEIRRNYFDPLRHFQHKVKEESKIAELSELIANNKPSKVYDLMLNVLGAANQAATDYGIAPEHELTTLAGTGSMKPNYEGGDIVLLKTHDYGELEIGDSIVFWTDLWGPDVPRVFHRIVDITEDGYITQGDNVITNDVPDPGARLAEHVEGKAILRIPLGDIPFVRNAFEDKIKRAKHEEELQLWLGDRLYHKDWGYYAK